MRPAVALSISRPAAVRRCWSAASSTRRTTYVPVALQSLTVTEVRPTDRDININPGAGSDLRVVTEEAIRWQTESSQAYPAPAAMDLKKPEWLSQAKRLVGTGEGERRISNVIPASPGIVTST